ncbi:MAG: aminotransferase class I/II-fold pyridoxal phosphate-dependent enzyme [SAR202 cluster bacterium]|nr:aminotransferase class I/II-fold pyridoxal phosphate-dependent enzyme [SAR202 cluster bacterium]
MRLPERVLSTVMPPIDALNNRMAELAAEGQDVISLGQSVPFFGPPVEMIAAVSEALSLDPRIHSYGPDAGIPELRQALAEKLKRHNGVDADPATQIMVTPGSNQAFMVAMLTLLEPGDEVAIAAPYYFNHHMAIELCGGRVVEAPTSEEDGFQLHLSDVEAATTDRTRAIVITSPNNPTGAVYDRAEVERIARFAADRRIQLVSDEAYEFFGYDGVSTFSPGSIPDLGDTVITLGSLSKTFGMTGWRIGYMVAGEEFCRQALKVQDATAICAPIISQIGAVVALGVIDAFTEGHLAELEARRDLLERTLTGIPSLDWTKTNGALFAFVKAAPTASGRELAWEVLDRTNMLMVPGSAFGDAWRNFVRISYGSSTRDRFEEALNRLAVYFDGSGGAGVR